ncbi:DUF4185 domain-containing protein [Streptomyces sp. ODS28]|uniref:DUF4185 domain-containing protein n=1 Tax=Streptomyces sp. ODS28 TaxID=3136688 RepID=UPI0031EFE582
MPEPGETRSTGELGLVSRRMTLKAGLGLAAGAALVGTAGSGIAHAGKDRLARANARKVGRFTGPDLTGKFGAHFVDLCIPVQLADGSLLFIGGDTYGAGTPAPSPEHPKGDDWRGPTGLRSHSDAAAGPVVIDGAVSDRPGHAKGLVPEDHVGKPGGPYTTALPSDVFRVGDTLYMHLMRGPIYDTHHTDFWKSTDNGETWTYLRQWPRELFGFQFQQKTYAADTGDDPYVYVMSTVFNRYRDSGLLLFRVLKSDLDKTDKDAAESGWGPKYAYQGWGNANGQWAWGNEPTSITETRFWGEICFRAMGGKYALSWFQPNNDHNLEDIRAQVFPLPTSDLFQGTEQTMVYASGSNPASDPESVQGNPYGGFIFPGSTFENFQIAVSNWNPQAPYDTNENYVVSQWRTRLDPGI